MVLQDVVVRELVRTGGLQVLGMMVLKQGSRRRRRWLLLLVLLVLQDCGRGCHCCGRRGEGTGPSRGGGFRVVKDFFFVFLVGASKKRGHQFTLEHTHFHFRTLDKSRVAIFFSAMFATTNFSFFLFFFAESGKDESLVGRFLFVWHRLQILRG